MTHYLGTASALAPKKTEITDVTDEILRNRKKIHKIVENSTKKLKKN